MFPNMTTESADTNVKTAERRNSTDMLQVPYGPIQELGGFERPE